MYNGELLIKPNDRFHIKYISLCEEYILCISNFHGNGIFEFVLINAKNGVRWSDSVKFKTSYIDNILFIKLGELVNNFHLNEGIDLKIFRDNKELDLFAR